jgi:integrase
MLPDGTPKQPKTDAGARAVPVLPALRRLLIAWKLRSSWHSLRHSFASMLATDLELPATTLARLTGHADAGFTLKVYVRDGRDETTVVDNVLTRVAKVGR